MQRFLGLRGRAIITVMLVIAIGLCFRFANLDRKVYWGDEVYSSLRIFGYTTEQLHQEVTTGQPIPALTLQRFQTRSPEKGVPATLQVLMQEDSHLTPLYFVLGRLWTELFGSSAAAVRSLSVLFSVVMLPALYWLAMELFATPTIAWTTVLLAVISPVQLIFAQEARFYSLWMLTTVVSSAALLRAMRVRSWGSWGIFAIVASANLYAQLLAVLTLAAQALYVLLITLGRQGKRDWQMLRQFVVAGLMGFGAFCPWLWIYLTRVPDATDAAATKSQSLVKAVKNLMVVFSRAFVDFNWDGNASRLQLGLLGILTLACLGIVTIALKQLTQEAKWQSWCFVLALLVVPVLPLLSLSLKDALPSRYLLPGYLALQLAVAYPLGVSWQNPQACRPRWFWSTAAAFVVAIGLLSCGSIARADGWWVKQYSACNTQVAQVVNQAAKPLVVSDGDGVRTFDHPLSNVVSLARMVKPETQFQVFLENQLPESIAVADGFSDRFLLTPSEKLLAKLEVQYPGQLQPLVAGSDNGYRNGQDYCLWRLPN
jgi:uncharacterized membrane protein